MHAVAVDWDLCAAMARKGTFLKGPLKKHGRKQGRESDLPERQNLL